MYIYPYYSVTSDTLLHYCGYIDGLVQERHNSIANALELCLFYTNPTDMIIFSVFMW